MIGKRSFLPAVVALALACSASAMASTENAPAGASALGAAVEEAADILDALFGWLPGYVGPTSGILPDPGVPVPGDRPAAPQGAAEDGGVPLTGSGGDESSGPWPVAKP
ncbi:MAG: hypothetical protein D6718_01865 [Acidobacteria bacterium]|nr:MAG: hypothetical protein D6718_01865 [Acidobacteriota bacterium]